MKELLKIKRFGKHKRTNTEIPEHKDKQIQATLRDQLS